MYCVIETVEEGERNCMAVPSSWVENNILCYPLQTREVNTARKRCHPPQPDWIRMPCTILRKNIETLKDALEKERETSIVSGTDNEGQHMHHTMAQISLDINSTFIQNMNNMKENYSSINNVCLPVVASPETESSPEKTYTNLDSASISDPPYNTRTGLQLEHVLIKRFDSAIELFKSQTDQILKNQATLQASLNLFFSKMPVQNHNALNNEKPEYEIPIETIESLDCFESQSKLNPEFRKQMIAYLSTFGGPHPSGCARNIIKILVSDTVLVNFSWTGTGSKNKKPFLPYKEIQNVLLQAVRSKFPTYTDHDNSRFLKDFIKSANTRLLRMAEQHNKKSEL